MLQSGTGLLSMIIHETGGHMPSSLFTFSFFKTYVNPLDFILYSCMGFNSVYKTAEMMIIITSTICDLILIPLSSSPI